MVNKNGSRFFGLFVAAVLVASFPGSGEAQSIAGLRGLGVPGGAPDGRSAALGSLGVGLRGLEISPYDPTATSELLLPTITFSMQPTWGDFELGAQSGDANGTRFPLLGIGYPVDAAGGVISVSLAGFLEQRWRVERPQQLNLGGSAVDSDDRFQSDGGASVARLGWSQRLGDQAAVGAQVGSYIGTLDQRFTRTLDTLDIQGGRPFVDEDSWRYKGHTFGIGGRFDPTRGLRLSAAAEWSTDLELKARDDTEEDLTPVSVPARYSLGATLDLTSRLALHGSLSLQDWSSAEGLLDGVGNGESLSYGGGVEWSAFTGDARSFPIRLGYRSVALPFRFDQADARESAFTGGLGFNFAESQGERFGWMDFAFERGSRDAGALSETFWRATFTVGISRF